MENPAQKTIDDIKKNWFVPDRHAIVIALNKQNAAVLETFKVEQLISMYGYEAVIDNAHEIAKEQEKAAYNELMREIFGPNWELT